MCALKVGVAVGWHWTVICNSNSTPVNSAWVQPQSQHGAGSILLHARQATTICTISASQQQLLNGVRRQEVQAAAIAHVQAVCYRDIAFVRQMTAIEQLSAKVVTGA